MSASFTDIANCFASAAGDFFDTLANGRAFVLAAEESVSARGGASTRWETTRTELSLPIIWDARAGQKIVVADKPQTVTVFNVALPAVYKGSQVVVQRNDHLRLLAGENPGLPNDLELQIQSVANRSGVQHEMVCLLVEKKAGG